MTWPLRVFVPPSADPAVLARLGALGADVVTCPRLDTDPPGDPCVHRFREAVAAGAVPFGVQGPENALCLDGGATLGFEIYEGLGHWVDRVFVQVGGGALVTGVGDGLRIGGVHPRIHAVQAAGCAPLARAWERAGALGGPPGAHWGDCMWPWEHEPRSAAGGILDDETYDWLGALDAMRGSGGTPVVSPEADVLAANELARTHTAIDADHTGTAGLAGLLTARAEVHDDERVVVVFSGARGS
jgi:threonine synthase